MKKTYTLGQIEQLAKDLDEYLADINRKKELFMERLAEVGRNNARLLYPSDIVVETQWINKDTIVVTASGEELLFIEFGTGITYGAGHPQAQELGMGPGTFPSEKGHWDDPNGWWYPTGTGDYIHTYGNPPSATMYNTARYMEQQVERIAREVFG